MSLSFLQFGSVVVMLSAFACSSSPEDGPESTGPQTAGAAGDSAGGHAAGAAGHGTNTAGERAMDSGVAGSGSNAAGAGAPSMEDAGVDDSDAAVSCEGEVVSGRGECLQDDAFCYPLGDGRWCTGPSSPQCPRNSTPIAKAAPCPERTDCFDYSESLRCARRLYTPDECAAAGGVALADPGDGSLVCPNDAVALGAIDGAGWDEGGLCCPASKRCGARAGDTCTSSEYCAYRVGQLCGAADAEATCKSRPSSCSGTSSPVCGCDQNTYPSQCEANAAGVGIYADAACK